MGIAFRGLPLLHPYGRLLPLPRPAYPFFTRTEYRWPHVVDASHRQCLQSPLGHERRVVFGALFQMVSQLYALTADNGDPASWLRLLRVGRDLPPVVHHFKDYRHAAVDILHFGHRPCSVRAARLACGKGEVHVAVFPPTGWNCNPYLLHGALSSLSAHFHIDGMGVVISNSRTLWHHQVYSFLCYLHCHHLVSMQIVYTLEDLNSSTLSAVMMLYPIAQTL